ncbi:hypothetical protein [Sagittula salina]|uniref:Uncharacterized protein n=1 Tax=Sagittula salina TaxID=2820268 RepID=A0A940S0E4_9RHOB|nr:hypothetical protein [Sagittula salina]MBP0482061.1 hypothetical protein [Sagittula salina]
MRITLFAALAALFAGPVLADQSSATVQSWNPANRTLVFTDKSMLILPVGFVLPENLAAGERVDITYQWKGEDGFGEIYSVARSATVAPLAAKSGL